jgi:hypothetical protein
VKNKMVDFKSDGDRFFVPNWLIGPADVIEKEITRRAHEWAAVWRTHRTFPLLTLVAPGPLAPLLYSSSDYSPAQPRARLFANVNFLPTIMEVFGYRDMETLTVDYETHVGRTPWGSFEALLFERSPKGLKSTRRRLEQIFPHLSLLSSTIVIDFDNAQRPATLAIDSQISSTLENWGAVGYEPLASRISATLIEMRRSNEDMIQQRILASMLRLVPIAPRLRNRE